MKPHTKDVIQYGSAVAMMATGIILAICSFFWLRLIHASVLTYMGEAVGFASAVYGLTVYSRSKIHEARELLHEEFEGMRQEFEEMKQELLNNQDNNDETFHDPRTD